MWRSDYELAASIVLKCKELSNTACILTDWENCLGPGLDNLVVILDKKLSKITNLDNFFSSRSWEKKKHWNNLVFTV